MLAANGDTNTTVSMDSDGNVDVTEVSIRYAKMYHPKSRANELSLARLHCSCGQIKAEVCRSHKEKRFCCGSPLFVRLPERWVGPDGPGRAGIKAGTMSMILDVPFTSDVCH